jgi:GNAT superfamily N-acetyltransferase
MIIVRIDEAMHHLETVAMWLFDEWGQHMPNGSISRAKKTLGAMPDARGLPVSFLAIDDNEPIGIARLIIDDMENRKDIFPWLASVFVPPKFRGRGIGTRLCNRVVEQAHCLGFSSIYLFTPDRERFYSRQGWAVAERTTYRDKDIVILKKLLKKD